MMGYNCLTLGQCQRHYDLLTKVVCDGDRGMASLEVDYELFNSEVEADDNNR